MVLFGGVPRVEEERRQHNVPAFVPQRSYCSHLFVLVAGDQVKSRIQLLLHRFHRLVLVAGFPCVKEEGWQHNVPACVPPRIHGSHHLDCSHLLEMCVYI